LNALAGHSPGEHEAGFLTNVRHQRLVEESLTSLTAAKDAIAGCIPHEMIMLDLYGALRPLDAITGETTADDILNLIFSSFCIGKLCRLQHRRPNAQNPLSLCWIVSSFLKCDTRQLGVGIGQADFLY